MNANKLGKWIMSYGAFLLLAGLLGYLSNPAKAKTALISGGTFGGLSLLWGFLLCRGAGWARHAALITTAFLGLVFTWRAFVSWQSFVQGQPEKLVPAVLITSMLLASVAALVLLLRTRLAPNSSPGD